MADLTKIHELISNVVLDSEIAAIATADSWAIIEAVAATDSPVSDLQMFSIARGEAWRQLRARALFPHDIPKIGVPSDPVAALSIVERTVLSLALRFKIETTDIALIIGESPKVTAAILKSARRELARAAIAITALTNPTRCPIMSQSAMTMGNIISRAQAMNLVSHCAECSICVPVLRTVDRQIVDDYTSAPMQEFVKAELTKITTKDGLDLVQRANLKKGWAPRDLNLSRDPKKLLQRTIIFGAISTILISLGLWISLN
ncbi:MAG: hypothetical protein RLZZ426_699 [Actinomycetota bacterium]